MGNEKLFYVGVKGLIRNKKGQYLLLKSSLRGHTIDQEPYWDIPGGRIEEGDDAVTTLRREIEEETGIIKVENPEFVTAVISNHHIPLNESRKAGLVLMVYAVEVSPDSTIALSPEHTDYGWFEAAETAEKLANKYPAEFTTQLS